MPEQLAEPSGENLGLSEPLQIAIEAKPAFAAGTLQGSHELTPKTRLSTLMGRKRVAGVDPVGVIQRESTGWEHTMDMGCRFPRQSENDMHVGSGQQLVLTCFEPAVAGIALAFWTMTIATRVVRDDGMSAAGTLIAMSAEGGGAAAGDGQQHLLMLPCHPLATAFDKGWSRCELSRPSPVILGFWRGFSFLLLRAQGQGVQRARGGGEMALGQMQVDGGLSQIVMSQQQPNGAQISTGF